MAKKAIINVTDFRGGYSTNIPDERMPGNMVRTGQNVYWEDGLRKRKGWSAYGATFPSAADFIFGSIRAFMNSKWTQVTAASLTASSTVIRFMTDNGTAKTFVEIDNSFTVSTSVEAADRFRFAIMKINGQDAVCGVDKESIQKPFVIYYDSGFQIKTIEEFDLRTRTNDDWFAGQYDVSESNPFFDKTSEAQSITADDFPLATTTNGDGFYVAGILTFNKVKITNATQFDDLDYKLTKSIYQAYTNLMTDPTDLTTGNWTEINGCVASNPSLTINGNAFTKLTTDGTANPQIRQIKTVTSGVSNVASVILRNGNLSGAETSTFFYIDNVGLATTLGQLTITWATKSVVQNDGDDFDYTWIDDDTVELYLEVTTDQVSTRFRIDPDNGTVAGKYIYATECQVVDSTTTMFPFVDGTHAIDIINETFTLPDQCTIVWRGKPRFAYDTASDKFFWSWRVDATHYLYAKYNSGASDIIQLIWYDGGTLRTINSYQFDDGSSFTDLNQEMIIVVSFDGSSGSQTGSRLIIIPLTSGAVNEDATFNATPDVKSSTFPTMSQGHFNSLNQADSEVSYTRVYEDLLVGAVTDEDTLVALLKDKTVLLDNTYTIASYQYYQGNDNWAPLSLVQEPDWTAAAGERILEFNYPRLWKTWDGAEAQDSVPSEVSGTLFNRFVIRVRFTTAPTSAQTADYFTVFHSQYLTQITDGDIAHQLHVHNSRLFLAAGSNVNYSPVGRITDWHVYDVETFIRGGDKIQKMISHRGYLAIFKGASIYGLLGNSVQNWVVKELDTTIGTDFPSSIAVVNQTIFFVGSDGYIYGFNGDVSKRLSKHIHSDMTTLLASYTPYAIHFESNFYLLLGPNILRFDPDTIREDDLGDGLVSFWKYITAASGISTLTSPVYFNGDQDNNFLVAQDDNEFIQLETSNYKDVHSGDNNIAIDVKTKDLSFGQFGLKKNYTRVKPDVEKAGNWTFTLLSDHEASSISVTLATGAGPGQYTEDVSVPYTIDGKDLTLRFQNTSAVFAAIYGYALNVARRVF